MTYNLDWIKHKFDRGETIKYLFFWGHTGHDHEEIGKFIFSQWYPSSFTVGYVEYKTAEHWMMAGKAKLFDDHHTFLKIIDAEKPGEVKTLGRLIQNFDQAKWDDAKYEIVLNGNIHKFSQHPKLKEYLLNTGDRVIAEASPVDPVWGIGLAQDAKNIENPHTWKGMNLLGFALMETRDLLTS